MALSQNAAYSSPSDTFENTYVRSYSHGLEKIYALENVDIRSVRKIALRRPICKTSKKISKTQISKPIEQLEFAFEPHFQKTIFPFVYKEPIQVLGLSKKIEHLLLAQEKYLLADLLNDRQEVTSIKGMGQGHIDEISEKLHGYLEEHLDSIETKKIDFSSWLKTLTGNLEPKKCAVLLEYYELPPLLHLSPAENADLRKLTSEKRSRWIEEAIQEVCKPEKKQQIESDLRQIVNVFIKPWLHRRNGIATTDELQEYLIKLGDFYPHTLQALSFIGALYFKENFPLAPFLTSVEEGLFCENTDTADTFHKAVEIARTYFYNDDLHYSLDALTHWIRRELTSQWLNFTEGFLERSLRLSSHFRIRKNSAEQLTVKQS